MRRFRHGAKRRKRTRGFVWAGLFSPRFLGGIYCAILLWNVSGLAENALLTSQPIPFKASARVGFQSRSPTETGIEFQNLLTEMDAARNRVLLNGSGLAFGDYDGDGLVDLYLCGLNNSNVLYRNLGDWRFQDVTAESGLACEGIFCRGAVMSDLNGDGALDVLVSSVGQGVLYFVNHNGTFTEETAAAGLSSDFGSSSMALADVNGDGALDLYVSNYRSDDIRDSGRVNLENRNGKLSIPTRLQSRLFLDEGVLNEYGEPDQLFLNDGQGRFKMVGWASGAFLDENGDALSKAPLDWGLSVAFRDVNGDRLPDLFVCNDYWSPDRFWINQGQGVFKAISSKDWRSMSASSMGVDFADIDLDGDIDFLTVDMLSRDLALRKRQREAQGAKTVNPDGVFDQPQALRNSLFVNRGDGSYVEMAYYAGLEASDWSWTPIFLDVDSDGLEDLLISAGHAWDVQDLDAGLQIQQRQHSWGHIKDPVRLREAYSREMLIHNRLYPKLGMPIVAFRNLGDRRFKEVTNDWGLSELGVRHGMAIADLDNDGDADLVANRLNGPVSIYENLSGEDRISVELVGSDSNTQAVGAVCVLETPNGSSQQREVISGGRYLSGADSKLFFSFPNSDEAARLVVKWRNGGVDAFENIQANRHYVIEQRTVEEFVDSMPNAVSKQALFRDVSDALGHQHVDPAFNEFVRQPLLPRKMSRVGPGIAWADLNGDRHDDLVFGEGQGEAISVYYGDGQGGWKAERLPSSALPTDITGVLVHKVSDTRAELIVAESGYERSNQVGAMTIPWDGQRFLERRPFAQHMKSAGTMALGDLKGNGTLALFVAGYCQPGQYPLGGQSGVYLRRNGSWVFDSRNSVVLQDLGIVNGAVWSDLSGDGYPELILACEWGPVRIFENRQGQLYEVTEEAGLGELTGWWRGVTSVDLNGDGAMDLVATNWGENAVYRASPSQPLVFYHGELSRPGIRDLIETEYDPQRQHYGASRLLLPLATSLPFLAQTFSSHRDFSEASIQQVLSARLPLARMVQAKTLSSMVFINKWPLVQGTPLPESAQIAPASGLVASDFDGDGNEDVFLAQNYFSTRPGVARHDSGRGQLFLGDGKGSLTEMGRELSGIGIFGDQRAAAVGDFDKDGRMDLVVTQNGWRTKLFRNQGAKPGLRVRLQGPPGNPNGLGAQLRLANGTKLGPAKEIHGGGGYLSQSSPIIVFHGVEPGASIWIQWPGGRVANRSIPEGTAEIELKF